MRSGDWLEPLLDLGIRAFKESGTRLVQTQALVAAITAVRAVRAVLFLHYLIQLTVFLAASGLALGLYGVVEQLWQGEALHLTPAVAFGWGAFLVFGAALAFSLRERLWIRALGIDEMIERIEESAGAPAPEPVRLSPRDLETLAALVDQAVERRLKAAQSAKAADSEEDARKA